MHVVIQVIVQYNDNCSAPSDSQVSVNFDCLSNFQFALVSVSHGFVSFSEKVPGYILAPVL